MARQAANVNWYGPHVAAMVKRGMARNLAAGAAFYAGQAVKRLGRGGAPTEHSAPWESPISHTGFLRQRIGDWSQGMKARFGTGLPGKQSVPYAAAMELGARPHVIVAKAAKVLANVKTGQIFGRKVNHPGNLPRPFLRPALYKGRAAFLRIMGRNVI